MEADTDAMIREDSTDESYSAKLDSIMVIYIIGIDSMQFHVHYAT